MTMNSTTSELMQDNSSTECVSPETNPITTVQNDGLIFGQKHNGIDCALCPTAKRACDRAWVTAKNLEVWSKMSTTTLWRWLGRLENARRIQSFSDMKKIKIDDNNGRGHETTLYNLNVLNQLAMACIDNEKLNEVSCKFSDILSEVETTGSYSVNQTQPQFALPKTLPEALRLYAAEIEARERALQERDETKALLAEEKEKVNNLERTKAWISDKQVASAMGTASAKTKECERLKKELDKVESERDLQIYNAREAIRKEFEDVWMTARDWCFNHKLPVYNNEPKWTVSNILVGICAAHPERETWHAGYSGVRLFPKWACDILDKRFDDDDTFLSEYRTAQKTEE